MTMTKVDKIVASAFDSFSGVAMAQVNRALNDSMTVNDLAQLSIKLPYQKIDVKQIIKQIDEIHLTRSEYDEYVEYAKDAVKKANHKLSSEYDDAQYKITEVFKKILKSNFTYNGKNKDKVFDILYDRAYETGHANGYTEIQIEFNALDELLNDITKATM